MTDKWQPKHAATTLMSAPRSSLQQSRPPIGSGPQAERLSSGGMTPPGYVCPDCKAPLELLFCPSCGRSYPCVDGVPCLLSSDPKFEGTAAIAAAYDSIYATRSNVWENQGRTPEFIRYFASLLDGFAGDRLLEIGCGEGFLLAALRSREKFAVDLSGEAIRKAQARTQAHFCLALSERLPFPNEHFHLVTSVGVMEHFLDIGGALREIRRVLKPGGHYVSLTHVELSFAERVAAKFSEYVFPRPRPIRFARWFFDKFRVSLVRQPIQNRYTADCGKNRLAEAGFDVREVVRRTRPDQPLFGRNVVIYIAQKHVAGTCNAFQSPASSG